MLEKGLFKEAESAIVQFEGLKKVADARLRLLPSPYLNDFVAYRRDDKKSIWLNKPYPHEQLLVEAHIGVCEREFRQEPLTKGNIEDIIVLFEWISDLDRDIYIKDKTVNEIPPVLLLDPAKKRMMNEVEVLKNLDPSNSTEVLKIIKQYFRVAMDDLQKAKLLRFTYMEAEKITRKIVMGQQRLSG